ncbi:MAG TPA: type IV pilus modification protein PilV [Steroidobacteraceae bacterium]|nr:type IV pilus modification protein PilV [Steroidobacteraceae bacterium]
MSRGFSLIEALVALIVLSVGLLGAAGLLLGALRDQSLALRQAAATVLLIDMADRIRANPEAREAYAGPAYAGDSPCGEADDCDALALAAHDLAHFESAAHRLLPQQQPRAQINFEPATGPTTDRYVISLTWIDARDSEASGEATLALLVQPVAGAA